MTPRILFRSLVGLSVIVGALYDYGFSTIASYPESWRSVDLLKLQTWAFFALGPLLAIASLVAYIGLFLFWGPARTILVIYLAGGILVGSFIEYPQLPGWVESLHQVDLVIRGLLIGVMYLPPFTQLFERSAVALGTAPPPASRP
jgi:hypothetical protein